MTAKRILFFVLLAVCGHAQTTVFPKDRQSITAVLERNPSDVAGTRWQWSQIGMRWYFCKRLGTNDHVYTPHSPVSH